MTALALHIDNTRLRLAASAAPQRLAQEMDLAITRIVKEMARTARRKVPKAHSTLANSIRDEKISSFEAAVVAGVNYALDVEEGTDPQGMPPVLAIFDWIRVKNIEPNDPTMDQSDLAFVIARSIAHAGTPAQPYAAPALEAHRAGAEQRISRAIDIALGIN